MLFVYLLLIDCLYKFVGCVVVASDLGERNLRRRSLHHSSSQRRRHRSSTLWPLSCCSRDRRTRNAQHKLPFDATHLDATHLDSSSSRPISRVASENRLEVEFVEAMPRVVNPGPLVALQAVHRRQFVASERGSRVIVAVVVIQQTLRRAISTYFDKLVHTVLQS